MWRQEYDTGEQVQRERFLGSHSGLSQCWVPSSVFFPPREMLLRGPPSASPSSSARDVSGSFPVRCRETQNVVG